MQEARARFTEMVASVKAGQTVVVMKHGQPVVGLVSPLQLVMVELMSDQRWDELRVEAEAWLREHPEGTVSPPLAE